MRALCVCLLAAEDSRAPTACTLTGESWLSGAERLCCGSWAVWVPQLPMSTSTRAPNSLQCDRPRCAVALDGGGVRRVRRAEAEDD